jgi:ribonuclease P protein component
LQRLKTREQFQAVLAGGIVARTTHFALHSTKIELPVRNSPGNALAHLRQTALFSVADVWMGAMVPKRWAKRAVTRNTIKRQIYSVSHDLESTFPVAAHVVRLRCGFDRLQFLSATSEVLKEAVRLELQQLFASAQARRSGAPARGATA